jgi:predicted Zn-dependent peptidase
MLTIGREPVVSEATTEAIAAHHRQYVKAGSSVLAIYGDFDPAEVRRRVGELFAAMPPGQVEVPTVVARQVPAEGETHVHESKTRSAGITVAAPGMTLRDLEDRLAISVLDTIISGYRLPRGWLHSELRGKRLVYVVHAYNWAALVPGAFAVYANCEPAKVAEVAAIIRRNLRDTLDHEYTREEIDEAVNIILTVELLQNQEMADLAIQAALDELYGFGYDFRKRYEKLLRAVGPAEVARVARKYLAGGLVTTIVTPQPAAARR